MISTPHRRHANQALAAVVSATALFSALLYRFPPARYHFYPQCPFHQYTGLLCPGCGATRALSALVHGDISAAVHFNVLTVILLPLFFVWLVFAYQRAITGRTPAWPKLPNQGIPALLVLTTVFTLIRNRP
jgi:hypothetical protein